MLVSFGLGGFDLSSILDIVGFNSVKVTKHFIHLLSDVSRDSISGESDVDLNSEYTALHLIQRSTQIGSIG